MTGRPLSQAPDRTRVYDAVVVGGGVMGCSTALHLARGGMSVAMVERRGLGVGASGVNAGTLSLQIKRAVLAPYALKSRERWASTRERLGMDVDYHMTGGLTLAFTDEEAEVLTARMSERKAAGVPIEMISGARAKEMEPGLGDGIVLASYCAIDGYANSSMTGRAYRHALVNAGVALFEGEPVTALERDGKGYTVRTPAGAITGRRLVLAAGAWTKGLSSMLGVDFPIDVRVNMVSVTERLPRLVKLIVGHAYGLLTLKQSDNGTTLIGGGWQGKGTPERGAYEVIPENLEGNLRLASIAVPGLRQARIVRTWLGLEASVPDMFPLCGDLPGNPDAYIIACVRGGYTIGPYMGELLSQHILGREPEMPIFNPARYNSAGAERATA